jgi:hypothetical protein
VSVTEPKVREDSSKAAGGILRLPDRLCSEDEDGMINRARVGAAAPRCKILSLSLSGVRERRENGLKFSCYCMEFSDVNEKN